jgi:hypothetical protein
MRIPAAATRPWMLVAMARRPVEAMLDSRDHDVVAPGRYEKGSVMDDSDFAMPHGPDGRPAGGDPMWPATATIEVHAHVAAAAYLMRRTHATELVVITNDASRRPIAVITGTDIVQAVADGRNIDKTHIDELVADGRLRIRA